MAIQVSKLVNLTPQTANRSGSSTADGVAFEAELNKAKSEIDALQKFATSAQETGDLESLKKVAKDFEEIFINMLMKSMRSTIEESGLMEKSSQRGMFEGMLDEEFTKKMVESGGIGIQEMMVRQLSRYVNQDLAVDAEKSTGSEEPSTKATFDGKG